MELHVSLKSVYSCEHTINFQKSAQFHFQQERQKYRLLDLQAATFSILESHHSAHLIRHKTQRLSPCQAQAARTCLWARLL